MIRHFADGRSDTARRAGFLYAFNTFGAVIGSTAAGFFLIPRLGAGDATTDGRLAQHLRVASSSCILLEKDPRDASLLIPIVTDRCGRPATHGRALRSLHQHLLGAAFRGATPTVVRDP